MKPWIAKSASDYDRRNLDSAFRDGWDSAGAGEIVPDYWELIDLGYLPLEALYFLEGHREYGQ